MGSVRTKLHGNGTGFGVIDTSLESHQMAGAFIARPASAPSLAMSDSVCLQFPPMYILKVYTYDYS